MPKVEIATETRWRSTTEVAALAGTTRHTVEREIGRGNIAGQRLGRVWMVDRDEASRWAAQFQPYAALRKNDGTAGG